MIPLGRPSFRTWRFLGMRAISPTTLAFYGFSISLKNTSSTPHRGLSSPLYSFHAQQRTAQHPCPCARFTLPQAGPHLPPNHAASWVNLQLWCSCPAQSVLALPTPTTSARPALLLAKGRYRAGGARPRSACHSVGALASSMRRRRPPCRRRAPQGWAPFVQAARWYCTKSACCKYMFQVFNMF
jgi:hypothetical protein